MEAGEPVPNDMMAELIREIMLSKVIGSKVHTIISTVLNFFDINRHIFTKH